MTRTYQTLFTETNLPQIVRVAVPLALPKTLDYQWGGEAAPQLGAWVEVEVGKKKIHGLVVELVDESPYKKLKAAYSLSVPCVSPKTVQFYRWVTQYTLAMPGDSIRAALVSAQVPEKVLPEQTLVLTGKATERITEARQKVLDAVRRGQWKVSTLALEAGVSDAVVRGLIKLGVLEWQALEEKGVLLRPKLPELNEHQCVAANEIASSISQNKFAPFLLDGVMGSGKTEVYFDAIARVLEKDSTGQVLVLVPEIALTPQWLTRFKKRFGAEPTIWHSNISDRNRRKGWWDVAQGKSRVTVGARSSLFLPFQDLKLLIVDEEHDGSYKQEDVFRYNGRDMAVTAAHIWQCPVVLASATPSLETWQNMVAGKYKHLVLPSRHAGAVMPTIRTVDTKKNPPSRKDQFLSPLMEREIARRLSLKEQSLIFLNRRGVAPMLICSSCGHRKECPRCDVTLVVHGHHLQCHHCGFSEQWPDACPKCHKTETWKAFGPGTRKILKELEEKFPEARLAVADSDAIHTDKQMGFLIERMETDDIDILVGTQMVAKGHHFPNLTFVGVVDSDMGLAKGEMRAAERTFQLLMQVSGRAGREGKSGEVMLQTYQPEHPLFEALKKCDREAFYNMELENRRSWGDPPFGRQIALIVSGEYEEEVKRSAQALVFAFPEEVSVEVLGPAPAPLAKLNDRYRFRILVKSSKPIQKKVQEWLGVVSLPRRVRVQIDVDPVTFF